MLIIHQVFVNSNENHAGTHDEPADFRLLSQSVIITLIPPQLVKSLRISNIQFSWSFIVALITKRNQFIWKKMHSMGISVKRTGMESIWTKLISVFRIQVNANNYLRNLISIRLSCHVPTSEQNVHKILESKFVNRLLCWTIRALTNFSHFSYLCGYIYLKSLDLDSSRCLFIHVPPIDEEHTVDATREGVLTVIKECIDQLQAKGGYKAK